MIVYWRDLIGFLNHLSVKIWEGLENLEFRLCYQIVDLNVIEVIIFRWAFLKLSANGCLADLSVICLFQSWAFSFVHLFYSLALIRNFKISIGSLLLGQWIAASLLECMTFKIISQVTFETGRKHFVMGFVIYRYDIHIVIRRKSRLFLSCRCSSLVISEWHFCGFRIIDDFSLGRWILESGCICLRLDINWLIKCLNLRNGFADAYFIEIWDVL